MTLTTEESEELDEFLTNEVRFSVMFGGGLLILSLAILMMSTMRLDVTSRMIYSLFRLYVVTGIGSLIMFARAGYFTVVSMRLVHGKMKFRERCTPCHVSNVKRSDLKGKNYTLLKSFGFRYAVRINSISESESCRKED